MFILEGDPSLRGRVFFSLKDNIELKEFFNHYGVKEGSYMASIITRLYNYIFNAKINLNDEYVVYYFKEYTTFKVFLNKYYYLEDDLIKEILAEQEKGKSVFLTNFKEKSDYEISKFLDSGYENNQLLIATEKFFERR